MLFDRASASALNSHTARRTDVFTPSLWGLRHYSIVLFIPRLTRCASQLLGIHGVKPYCSHVLTVADTPIALGDVEVILWINIAAGMHLPLQAQSWEYTMESL